MSAAKPAWFRPCLLLTVLVFGMGAALTPMSGITFDFDVLTFLAGWFSLLFSIAIICVTIYAIRLAPKSEGSLVRALGEGLSAKKQRLLWTACGVGLFALQSWAFNWVKAQLNMVFPFWADEFFAAWDVALFGVDPWVLIVPLIGDMMEPLGYFYAAWFPCMTAALAVTVWRRDDVAVTAFFITWGVFGTIVQAIFSAAGPVFWARLGLGDRFDGLMAEVPHSVVWASDYLWENYAISSTGIGAGISAMPSLHCAIAAWFALAFAHTKWRWVGLAYMIVILIGSVATGWHYAVDGVVGIGCAIGAFWLARLLIPAKKRGVAAPDMVPQPA